MFLSRVRLNPSRLQTRRMASSPQVTHALVEASAPPGGEHRAGRALWRLDQDDTGMDLYVVSPWRPDFTGLIEQAGWPTAPTWDTASYDRFLERLAEGQRWRFRVTANPTRSVPRGGGPGPCGTAPHRRTPEPMVLDEIWWVGVRHYREWPWGREPRRRGAANPALLTAQRARGRPP